MLTGSLEMFDVSGVTATSAAAHLRHDGTVAELLGYEVSAQELVMVIDGQTMTAGSALIRPTVTTDGSGALLLDVDQVAFDLQAGATTVVRVSEGSGSVLMVGRRRRRSARCPGRARGRRPQPSTPTSCSTRPGSPSTPRRWAGRSRRARSCG